MVTFFQKLNIAFDNGNSNRKMGTQSYGPKTARYGSRVTEDAGNTIAYTNAFFR